MGLSTGAYSKGPTGGFEEEKRHLLGLVQRKIPWIDADENRKEFMRFNYIRRGMQVLLDSSSPNDGFKCVGDGATNDFQIKGGSVEPYGGGRIWVGGFPCLLIPDIRFVNAGANEGERSIHAKITALGVNFVEDSSANYLVNELAGRTITPDVTTPATFFTVVSNTATKLTLSGNPVTAGIVVGDRYRLELTTPPAGPARTDGVYLNAYLDEIDGVEDPTILHNIGSPLEAQRFFQVVQTIFVREDVPLLGEFPTAYLDADGNQHYALKIATIVRPALTPGIVAPDVTDLRKTSGDLTAFVRKIGDTMTGDLVMGPGADIALALGNTVDGRDVSVDGAYLDTIDFTGTGVSALVKKQGRGIQGSDLIGVTGSTKNVSDDFRQRTAGGTDVVAGAVTDPPFNLCKIRGRLDRDEILDANANKVIGRLTYASLALTGTLTFQNASNSVTGVGTSFTTQLQVGDILTRDDDGTYITVATIPSNVLLTTVQAWPGTNGAFTGTRRRYTLSFLARAENGIENAHTFSSSVDLAWSFLETFPLYLLPTYPEDWIFPSDQLAGDIADATTLLAGKVVLAAADEIAASKAVQANDPRVTTPFRTSSSLRKKFLEILGTGGTSVIVDDTDPDKLKFTINTSVVGGSFPGFGGSPVADDNPALAGSTGFASDAGHRHPLSSQYRIRTAHSVTSATTSSVALATGFTPRLLIVLYNTSNGGGTVVGVGVATGVANQGCLNAGLPGNSGTVATGKVVSTGGGPDYAVSQFDTTQVNLARTGGANATDLVLAVIGDILP